MGIWILVSRFCYLQYPSLCIVCCFGWPCPLVFGPPCRSFVAWGFHLFSCCAPDNYSCKCLITPTSEKVDYVLKRHLALHHPYAVLLQYCQRHWPRIGIQIRKVIVVSSLLSFMLIPGQWHRMYWSHWISIKTKELVFSKGAVYFWSSPVQVSFQIGSTRIH